MKPTIIILIFTVLQVCYAPPVSQNKEKGKAESESDGLEDYMEYHRYLREVVNALESDPEFRQKLEKANEEDIRSGKIAHELEFVSHNVRTRLDEIKRTELERLRHLMEKKKQLQEGNDIDNPAHHHLDHINPHTFEIEDLKKLIAKTTEDLAEADKKRREEFKEYEMQKEFEKQQKLNHTTGEERAKLEKELKEQEEKHKKHEPLHEPGHKKQLEEVWEEQDHMQQEFDPKTFFMLHDLDSNGLWDQDEVKALFIKELDKMYAAGAPEDDMRERVEEMERMRETVFQEVDMNRDGFIDFPEFLAQTKRNDFQQDHGWQALDEQKPYTDEELAEYIRRTQGQYPGGYYPQQGYPSQGYHPGQAPPQGYPVPPGGYHPNQGQQPQGYHPNQVSPQGYHPNQAPPQGYGNQASAGGYNPNQGPAGGPNQNPPQGYGNQASAGGYNPNQGPAGYHPNQIPQGGYHPGQVAQGNAAGEQGQFQPGQLPQNPPRQLNNAQQVSQENNINNQAHLPDLNTNEVYVNPPNGQNRQPQQQQYQSNPVQQQNSQPVQNQQQNQPRVQQSNEQLRGENQQQQYQPNPPINQQQQNVNQQQPANAQNRQQNTHPRVPEVPPIH